MHRSLIAFIIFFVVVGSDVRAAGSLKGKAGEAAKHRLLKESYDRRMKRRLVARSTGFSYRPPRSPAIYHPLKRLKSVSGQTSRRAIARPRAQSSLDTRLSNLNAPIEYYSRVHALDPDLTRAVIAAESGGNPVSVSPKGARGVMQLMPRTASMLGVRNAFNPVENISGGTRYLRSLYDRFGRLDLVLWAYNAGPGAVERGRLPEETRTYIRNVYDHLKRFRNR